MEKTEKDDCDVCGTPFEKFKDFFPLACQPPERCNCPACYTRKLNEIHELKLASKVHQENFDRLFENWHDFYSDHDAVLDHVLLMNNLVSRMKADILLGVKMSVCWKFGVNLEDVDTPADLPIYKTDISPDDNSPGADAKRRKIDDAA